MYFAQDAAQAAESFLVSQLTYIEPQVYRVQYPNIRYPEIVPVDTSAPPWIPSVTYFSLDGAGKANWFNGRAQDVPLAELLRAKYETPVKMAAIGYEYDLEELNQAIMLGRDLTTDKAYYARLAAEQFVDKAAIFGDSAQGFLGIANNPTVTTGTAAAGAKSTNAVELADTLLLPLDAFGYAASTQLNQNSDKTILAWLTTNNVYTQRTGRPLTIIPVWGLDTAGSGGTSRMVTYWRDPTVVKMHMPMPFQFVGGIWRDGPMLWKVPGAFRFGGVDIKRPAAFRYVDGI